MNGQDISHEIRSTPDRAFVNPIHGDETARREYVLYTAYDR